MKKIMVDMDDVLTVNGFIRLINEFLQSNYKNEDANSYYINDLIPKDKMEEWIKFYSEKNVYDYVDVSKDAQEVMRKLNEKYDLYIATAFVFRDAPELSGKTLNDKYNFLCEKFSFINPRKFIFISNKDILEADIRIDDSIKKLNGKAELKLLYTAYHNKNINNEELKKLGLTRVNNWREIEKILL